MEIMHRRKQIRSGRAFCSVDFLCTKARFLNSFGWRRMLFHLDARNTTTLLLRVFMVGHVFFLCFTTI